jgi:putative hydrolase of the HAD superfamily
MTLPKKLLIWDFDHTLAYREGMWSGALIEVLDRFQPQHRITRDHIRPYLQRGFPWHTPNVEHHHLSDADMWWGALDPIFTAAFCGCGIEPEQARQLARAVRATYCDPKQWRLFDDVTPTLAQLAHAGWSHVILSNHVPELPLLVSRLPLRPYITAIYTSAAIGVEKPHPEAFRTVLRAHPDATRVWMIGDNWAADILGANAVHIPAILVRAEHPGARYQCANVAMAGALIESM